MPPPLLETPLRQAYARCEEIARGRLENFPVLSEHLPAEAVPHLAAVYAYCRAADDAADESGSAEVALARLQAIEEELRAAVEGREGSPEMAALAATLRAKRLPLEPFLDLLSAFRQDQRQTRYASFEELLGYCRHSADPVGRIVLGVLGEISFDGSEESRHKITRSDQICTGLQLANFWQDVSLDLEKGRLYVPLEELERHGVTERDLAQGRCDERVRGLLAALCARTAPLFAEGAGLADLVAPRLRIAILAFAIAGDRLLTRIREAGYDVFRRRPEIAERHTRSILARAVAARWIRGLRPRGAP